MKQLLIIILCALGVTAQAQTNFQIEPFAVRKGFSTDTATAVRFRCVSLDIDMITANQRPVFYLELVSEAGSTVDARNVTYQDMTNACVKNGIPENQHSTVIAQVYAATFCGTRAQKLAAIRSMMLGYGITLKPDNEQ